jgi:hypothetical protein
MLNRRMPNGTYGGVRGRFNPPYSIIKPSSRRRACTGGHLMTKEIERDTRDISHQNAAKVAIRKSHTKVLLFLTFYRKRTIILS